MNWEYRVIAADRPRVCSRVIHIFDQQRITIESFNSLQLGGDVYMRIRVAVEEQKGARIEQLLLRLQDIRFVTIAVDGRPAANNVTLCRAPCQRAARRSLLAALAGVGAAIVAVDEESIRFEITGDDSERTRVYSLLRTFWPLETLDFPA